MVVHTCCTLMAHQGWWHVGGGGRQGVNATMTHIIRCLRPHVFAPSRHKGTLTSFDFSVFHVLVFHARTHRYRTHWTQTPLSSAPSPPSTPTPPHNTRAHTTPIGYPRRLSCSALFLHVSVSVLHFLFSCWPPQQFLYCFKVLRSLPQTYFLIHS
jgi:hypothetical protein